MQARFQSDAAGDRANTVTDALEAHVYDDAYIALLSASMDGCEDLKTALALADKLYSEHKEALSDETQP